MTAVLELPAGFWSAVTGFSAGPDGWLVPARGDAYVRVGTPRLVLHVPGVPEAAREAVALGAQTVRDGVLRSPVGLEFGLVAWRGEREWPAAVRWPGGQSSLLDQLCLDVPAAALEAEAAFWAAVTGRERVRTDLPQFERLAGHSMQVLVQRIGADRPGMHPDFACDDVPAEVARHVGLGAEVVRVVPGDWTTLRDPAGLEYCVTARSPVPGFVGAS